MLEEDIYMSQPPGFVNSANKSLVCKLHKSLYGLKQAPRAWFDKLTFVLLMLGFSKSKCDPSLFTFFTSDATVFMLVYVDDIILTGNSPSLIQKFVTQLNATFSLKDLGTLDYFLGIEVKSLSHGKLLLSQDKYIIDLLTKVNMEDSKGISTPMIGGQQLAKGGTLFDDPTLYRSVVGALQYATITRPEIAFSVNKVSQFMCSPMEEHWKVVKRILRYLKGTVGHGLVFSLAQHTTPFNLTAFTDADWASDPNDRRSTSAACLYLGPNLVPWWSKKQLLVARSSIEAEYRALAQAVTEVLWIHSLMKELKVPLNTPTVLCDNQSTVALSHNPVLHARSKHMELDIFFVREKVLNKSLVVSHIPAQHQFADVLTKALSPKRFLLLLSKLNVADPSTLLHPP
uniref:Retrovirus-related Pol polyprotein from transposon TNT 1-94 n=1 Tax=Cajanus cajan TaxID=3821 RepID=A0A151SXK6_CAJCA|nr:Retrovirus-related Pol polyprotein from transposon TNT 1-94 [Cajanus cajan]